MTTSASHAARASAVIEGRTRLEVAAVEAAAVEATAAVAEVAAAVEVRVVGEHVVAAVAVAAAGVAVVRVAAVVGVAGIDRRRLHRLRMRMDRVGGAIGKPDGCTIMIGGGIIMDMNDEISMTSSSVLIGLG